MWLGKGSSGSARSAEPSGSSSRSVTLTSAGFRRRSLRKAPWLTPGRAARGALCEFLPITFRSGQPMAISQETDTTTSDVEPPAARKAERSLVLVAGSGRSGTSLFSGILQRLGYHVPQPEVPADSTNPRGFAESQWVVDFHARLLRRARVQTADARPSAWALTAEVALDGGVQRELRSWLRKQFRKSDAVVIKDPRLSWFLPLWRRCAEDLETTPRFVTVLRHPAAVVQSKQRSYG